jgi:hypothetical protein
MFDLCGTRYQRGICDLYQSVQQCLAIACTFFSPNLCFEEDHLPHFSAIKSLSKLRCQNRPYRQCGANTGLPTERPCMRPQFLIDGSAAHLDTPLTPAALIWGTLHAQALRLPLSGISKEKKETL